MSDLVAQGVDWLLGLMITVVIPWVFLHLRSLLQAKTKAEWAKAVEDKVTKVAQDVVLAMFQTARSEIEKARDPSSPGGKELTKEEAKGIFDKAMGSGLGSLGQLFVTAADAVLGQGAVASSLANKIEAAVLVAKNQGLDKVGTPASVDGKQEVDSGHV